MKLKIFPLNQSLIGWLIVALAAPCILLAATKVASAAPDAPNRVITIDASADAYLNSQNASTPFGADKSLIVSEISTLLAVQNRTLLRFDLSSLPEGSIINKAELHLFQTSATGDWTLNIDRITQSWDERSVTFRTAPPVTNVFAKVTAPLDTKQYISWDVTDLARSWQYQPFTFPNYGLQLRGETVINGSAGRAFDSREAANPPQLIIDYTPPPASIVIPFADSQVKIDAQCSESEYAGGFSTQYIDLNGYVGTIHLKQDNDFVYACITGVRGTFTQRSFGLYLDRNNGKEKYADSEDYWLQAYIPFAQTASYIGTGDSVTTWQATNIDSWTAAAAPGFVFGNGTTPDVAEFQLALSMVSSTCGEPFGIALYHEDINDNGVTYGFPTRIGPQFPSTWVQATLERPNCPIRVCKVSPDACDPATTATVYDAASDTAYDVDAQGYVKDRTKILDGTPLWAILPVEQTTNYSRYDTSGDPLFLSAASVNAGETVLVVTPQRPLQIQNLNISAEWFVEGDATKKAWLEEQLRHASNYLYKFSNRQFALGQITVQQSFDGWDDAQMRLHLNNVFQPRAVIGGIVPTTTIDPSPAITLTYNPGKINMGSDWNRYGKPPGQPIIVNGAPVNPATLQDDWSLAMAHEMSHYMLYLFDTYVDLNGQQTDSCLGSAMGDTYNPLNHGYIFSQDLWQVNCKQTIAYELLKGRYEWDTIKTWYQWVQPPSVMLSGTVRPPVDMTNIVFVPPTTAAGTPASANLFDLGYQDSETASAEARAFIFRDGRLLEQGKPAKGSTQLELLDPQLTDRLCVYDINDHAEGTESIRKQFGCEEIKADDTTLTMTKNIAWSPLVTLHQSDSNVLQMAVSQTVPSGTVVKAVLYPEYEQAVSTIDLTAVDGGLQGTFVLTQPVPPAYVQLFVDEAAVGDISRREVVFDRGTGGSGAFGPRQMFGGAQIVSSDGNAIYELDTDVELKSGQSITWQSMPGTPAVPEHSQILGQSYLLDAYPSALVDAGNVRIIVNLPEGYSLANLAVYFWNGSSWQLLPTTSSVVLPGYHADGLGGAHLMADDNYLVATAPSQGMGVYAVLTTNSNFIYLPLVQK